jgi:hypothetical protein
MPIPGAMSSAPPPSAAPPGAPRDFVIQLEGGGSWRRRRAVEGSLRFSAAGAVLDCDAMLLEPLKLGLGQLQIGAIDPGPARPGGMAGRFPILRRLGPNAVVPRQEGIEGWLWTSTGGSGMTSLGDEEDAPNAALLFTKPLPEDTVTRVFRPDFLEALQERSPLGVPAVLGLLFRVQETIKAESTFRRFGLLRPLTDREVPPTLRRSLPTDRSADHAVQVAEPARAATSVAPPGLG